MKCTRAQSLIRNIYIFHADLLWLWDSSWNLWLCIVFTIASLSAKICYRRVFSSSYLSCFVSLRFWKVSAAIFPYSIHSVSSFFWSPLDSTLYARDISSLHVMITIHFNRKVSLLFEMNIVYSSLYDTLNESSPRLYCICRCSYYSVFLRNMKNIKHSFLKKF